MVAVHPPPAPSTTPITTTPLPRPSPHILGLIYEGQDDRENGTFQRGSDIVAFKFSE